MLDPGRKNGVVNKCAGFILLAVTVSFAAYFTELVPKFKRTKSNAMVRKVSVPTMAVLDYAAYTANPVLHEPRRFKPRKPDKKVSVREISFNGALKKSVARIGETPLTAEERESPLAWRPLVRNLWDVVKEPAFSALTSKINGYKWADSSIYAPYQEIVAAYLHDSGDKVQVWVKIELKPWVRFIADAVDADSDGFREFYGHLNLDTLKENVWNEALRWIRNDYQKRILSEREVTDWITELASYWYPSKNTDILERESVWPGRETERKVRRTMKGVTVENPTAIVRGRPFGKPVYNVYVVENMRKTPAPEPDGREVTVSLIDRKLDSSSASYIRKNSERFTRELKGHGDYTAWADEFSDYYKGARRFLDSLPKEQKGFEGKDGWLFFRKDLEYLLAGNLSGQKYEKDPIAHCRELNTFLEKNDIALLFVAVPNKAEVYYEKLPFAMPEGKNVIVNPYSRKILKDLQDGGVEVVDLLPAFLEAKAEDDSAGESVYQKHDTHWTTRGLHLAAEAIADRLSSYDWYATQKRRIAYTAVDTFTMRQGDIVDRLPEKRRAAYSPVRLSARQVFNPDGTPFKSSKDAPVILMGDSFTGVFESVDCKSAGVASAIAEKTGLSLDIITSWGGGPLVRSRFIRHRGGSLDTKRVVVYMMVARDLYDYEQLWEKVKYDDFR